MEELDYSEDEDRTKLEDMLLLVDRHEAEVRELSRAEDRRPTSNRSSLQNG